MNRSDKNFNMEKFANRYIKKHSKLLKKIGKKYAKEIHNLDADNGKMLDVGCGFGWMDLVIAREFPECEITGIDLSEPLLSFAKKSTSHFNLDNRLHFIIGDVTCLPFNDNEFDVIFNVNMVHWVKDPVKMLNEISRVLKPDGFFFIKDLKYSWLCLFEDEIGYSYSFNDAKDLIKKSNLKGGTFKQSLLWWEYNLN